MRPKFNPFHLVEVSPWPLLASNGALSLVVSGLVIINKVSIKITAIALVLMMTVAYLWWRDVHREAATQGNHSELVINGLKTGIILFIASEILFFVSFFWAFFHSSVSPTVELGQIWPPLAVNSFNPIRIPLLNTILLLSSGVRVTWSHHEIIKKNFKKSKISLIATVCLGVIFTAFQGFEYLEAPFCIADSSFGSTFFIATGFHGLHVILGTIFLLVSLLRFNKLINSSTHIVGFECAAWYWHFVDVVWLFLYSMLYWWGAFLFSIPVHLISNKKGHKNIKISFFLITALILVTLLCLITNWVQKKSHTKKERWQQFECGFNAINPSHLPFSFQFFLIALLFLIFDIEIALILAYPLEISTSKSCSALFIFVTFLTIGLFYEWQKGKIEWSK